MFNELQYEVGDLIAAAQEGSVNVIAHGCNCFNAMGSGIAPLIAKAFPEAYAADQATTKGDQQKLGSLSYGIHTRPDQSKLTVFNLYSQYGYWGRREGKQDLDMPALRSAVREMAFLLTPEQSVIGIPKIGAGLAGGDWDKIEPIFIEEFTNAGFDVTLFLLECKEVPVRKCPECNTDMKVEAGPFGIHYGCSTVYRQTGPDLNACPRYWEFHQIKR